MGREDGQTGNSSGPANVEVHLLARSAFVYLMYTVKSFIFLGPNFRGFRKMGTSVGTLFRGSAGWFK